MKITLLCEPDGSIYITLPSNGADPIIGTAECRKRLGTITLKNGYYSVAFITEGLQAYNRGGFKTRNDAVSYEQMVLDEHLIHELGTLFSP